MNIHAIRYDSNQYFEPESETNLLDFLNNDPDLIVEPFLQGKHWQIISIKLIVESSNILSHLLLFLRVRLNFL